jgi:hypothetical protein
MGVPDVNKQIFRGIMGKHKKSSVILFWLVTGISVLLVYSTYIKNNISLESGTGTVVFGFMLLMYLFWFIYDSFVSDPAVTFKDAVKFNLTGNPAVWSMYFFWVVFLAIPLLCSPLLK